MSTHAAAVAARLRLWKLILLVSVQQKQELLIEQVLESGLVEVLVSDLLQDRTKFHIGPHRITATFSAYASTAPLRSEAIFMLEQLVQQLRGHSTGSGLDHTGLVAELVCQVNNQCKYMACTPAHVTVTMPICCVVGQVKRHKVVFAETEMAFYTTDGAEQRSVRRVLGVLAATGGSQMRKLMRQAKVPTKLLELLEQAQVCACVCVCVHLRLGG